ncbi:MAG: alpha/beta hydrolase [Paracoccaceae bacterium]|nr:alpha/beta hydrolase [Paracoccaceae bacterium]
MRQNMERMTAGRSVRNGILALALIGLAACNSQAISLGEAPYIYTEAGSYPAQDVPANQRTTRPQIYYVTDRAPQPTRKGGLGYGIERSSSMVFGASEVAYGSDLGWDGLVAASTQAGGSADLALTVLQSREIVRFSSTPLPFDVQNGRAVVLDQDRRDYETQTRAFQAEIKAALRKSDRKEVMIFVHGFRNSFDDAQASLASIWHYSGRIGVPVVYTWPANNPGMFGYFKDRESGEFSIYHFKEFLRMLAEIPELEDINIIAHSRGTDVATSALREMMIAERAAGHIPRKSMKINNLILVAPDLDFGVVRQRLIAERFGTAFGQITIYLNPRDGSLGLAQTLMAGTRLGRISFQDLGESERESFRRIRNVNFIDVESVSRAREHSYFHNNPSVVSDIVLTLRTDARPGTTTRPLEQRDFNFWNLPKGYPFGRPKLVYPTDNRQETKD